jgi:hypothetical protein
MASKFLNRVRRYLAKRLQPKSSTRHSRATFLSGDIVLINDFLPSEEFIALQRWAFDIATPHSREDRSWKELIKRDFGENKSSRQWASNHDDMPPEPKSFVEALRKAKIVEQSDIIHLAVYRWEQMSGMGVHTDGFTDTAISFYMNDVWSPDWGGDFIYYESSDHLRNGTGQSVMPQANRLVVNRSTIHHKVNYCSNTAQDRVSVQAFVFKQEPA